jgi:hypothetical protein
MPAALVLLPAVRDQVEDYRTALTQLRTGSGRSTVQVAAKNASPALLTVELMDLPRTVSSAGTGGVSSSRPGEERRHGRAGMAIEAVRWLIGHELADRRGEPACAARTRWRAEAGLTPTTRPLWPDAAALPDTPGCGTRPQRHSDSERAAGGRRRDHR